jgi:hypothetical protein
LRFDRFPLPAHFILPQIHPGRPSALLTLSRVSNGVRVDDDEIRTGNAMILDPYGRILAETWKAEDAMVIADLEASLLAEATGRLRIRVRRPELYGPLSVPTGLERDTRTLKFQE